MIGDGERQFRASYVAMRDAKTFERLRTRHLMYKVTVDVDEARAVILPVDDVTIPDFVVEGLGHFLVSKHCGNPI
jgi:hypothetical protein